MRASLSFSLWFLWFRFFSDIFSYSRLDGSLTPRGRLGVGVFRVGSMSVGLMSYYGAKILKILLKLVFFSP